MLNFDYFIIIKVSDENCMYTLRRNLSILTQKRTCDNKLQPRVSGYQDTMWVVLLVELAPISATFLHRTKVAITLQNIFLPFDKLYTKASGNMEWDMAVHLECHISTDSGETVLV